MPTLEVEDPMGAPNPGAVQAAQIKVPNTKPQLRVVDKSPLDPTTISVPGPQKGGEGGKEGKSAPSASVTPSNAAFLGVVFADLPAGARPVIAGKPGDPRSGGWFPSDATKVGEVCGADRNTYFNCASLHPDEDGSLSARKEKAAAYHALVLDDVGTKVAWNLLPAISPTWEIETSPGNFQIGFKLCPPLTDPAEVEALQKRVAAAGLTDKGALGMVRWARLPNGINGKPAYADKGKPFNCRLHRWEPANSYSAKALQDSFGIAERSPGPAPSKNGAVQPAPSFVNEGQVYFPKSDQNPVLTAFKDRGLYKRQIVAGRHDVTCPWLNEHTDQIDTGAAYFEPDTAFPSGGFCCQHSHKDQYHISQVLRHFGLSGLEGRNKALIRTAAGEMNAILAAAEDVLVKQGGLYQSGGVIVGVNPDPVTSDATLTAIGEPALTLALSAAADWERFDARKGAWVRSDPPPRHVSMLYKAQSYARLPKLRGLARQPYYDDAGVLHTAAGYDSQTQRFSTFDAGKFPTPGSSEADAQEALALLQELLREFHFASEVDRAAALAAIFTAVTRPSLGLAPAFHVSAPNSGSGKSYLCETISLFAGPSGSSQVSYPKTSEEATKAILSLLLAAPAVIEFDDMDTDWLPHGVINRMLTSQSISDRVLGVSKIATVSTSALILGSGNNVGPLRDLARRVLTINLNARSETPGTLAYQGNPVADLKADRGRYVAAVLTIIEAWKAAGSPRSNVPSIASYGGAWADYCRHPLIWMGLPDPATPLLEQMKTDPDADVLLHFLQAWHDKHGEKTLELRQLLNFDYKHGGELEEAILDLPVVEKGNVNRSRLGHYLKRNRERLVAGLMLQKAEHSARNAWKVVKAERGNSPPTPPLPSSPPANSATQAEAGLPEDAY